MGIPAELDRGSHGLDQAFITNDTYDAPQPQAWTITDLGSAEWAMRHFVLASERIAEIDRQAAAWQADIDTWREAEKRKVERRYFFFQGKLIDFAIRRRLDDPTAKSLRLPSGTVSTRPATPMLGFTPELLARWAVSDPDLVRVKVEAAVAEIRKRFVTKDDKLVDPETGVIVDGATVVQPLQPFSVTVTVAEAADE